MAQPPRHDGSRTPTSHLRGTCDDELERSRALRWKWSLRDIDRRIASTALRFPVGWRIRPASCRSTSRLSSTTSFQWLFAPIWSRTIDVEGVSSDRPISGRGTLLVAGGAVRDRRRILVADAGGRHTRAFVLALAAIRMMASPGRSQDDDAYVASTGRRTSSPSNPQHRATPGKALAPGRRAPLRRLPQPLRVYRRLVRTPTPEDLVPGGKNDAGRRFLCACRRRWLGIVSRNWSMRRA